MPSLATMSFQAHVGMALFFVAKVGNIPFHSIGFAILPWLVPPMFALAPVMISTRSRQFFRVGSDEVWR